MMLILNMDIFSETKKKIFAVFWVHFWLSEKSQKECAERSQKECATENELYDFLFPGISWEFLYLMEAY